MTTIGFGDMTPSNDKIHLQLHFFSQIKVLVLIFVHFSGISGEGKYEKKFYRFYLL